MSESKFEREALAQYEFEASYLLRRVLELEGRSKDVERAAEIIAEMGAARALDANVTV